MNLRNVPTRLAAGAFVLNSGVGKWNADEQTAAGVHGMAAGAYPFLKSIPPKQFVKALSVAEMSIGGLLLTPFVPTRLAGLALTAFGGGLVGMYVRTPALHQAGSLRPTQAGVPIAKDSWLLAIGLSLLIDAGLRKLPSPSMPSLPSVNLPSVSLPGRS